MWGLNPRGLRGGLTQFAAPTETRSPPPPKIITYVDANPSSPPVVVEDADTTSVTSEIWFLALVIAAPLIAMLVITGLWQHNKQKTGLGEGKMMNDAEDGRLPVIRGSNNSGGDLLIQEVTQKSPKSPNKAGAKVAPEPTDADAGPSTRV
ncbi:hypothetical protein CYMTET_27714 [Cymbomonas tetramitiformis]|uniref:Uncharacterized protein n=1 Tax=Cymbomonas tetramitiformis TaxID=36881 RepID=A0AAE0FQT2_9CHLO|nr:hypothetical protein CYMTET_27714 [Cymbomonas tetramitiformis]